MLEKSYDLSEQKNSSSATVGQFARSLKWQRLRWVQICGNVTLGKCRKWPSSHHTVSLTQSVAISYTKAQNSSFPAFSMVIYRNYESIPFRLIPSYFLKHSSLLADHIDDLTNRELIKCVLSMVMYDEPSSVGCSYMHQSTTPEESCTIMMLFG